MGALLCATRAAAGDRDPGDDSALLPHDPDELLELGRRASSIFRKRPAAAPMGLTTMGTGTSTETTGIVGRNPTVPDAPTLPAGALQEYRASMRRRVRAVDN